MSRNMVEQLAYLDGHRDARRELARELRRLYGLRLKAIAREIKRLREWPNIPEADRVRRLAGMQAREIEVALMIRALDSAMRATRGR